MHGTAAAPTALGSIQIGNRDEDGNWPMVVKVSNLAKLPPRGYYTLWLTRKGKPIAPCGIFRAHGDKTSVTFTVAYTLNRFDGWVVTPSLGHGALSIADATGRVLRSERVARSSHDACVV